MQFFTIGVFNSTGQEFFDKLIESHIDKFRDICQRRGVRGGKYASVNSNILRDKKASGRYKDLDDIEKLGLREDL